MTSNLPPAEVLAARLEHALKSAAFYADDPYGAQVYIFKAQQILAQLREAMK